MALRTPPRSKKIRWHDDPEVRLMLRVADDDEEAFADLTNRYTPRVFGHFCRQLGSRVEAEDLTQEVFLRLFRSRKRYRPKARFGTWVFHIMQNVLRNALRSRRRHPCARLDFSQSATEDRFQEVSLPDRAEPPSRPVERTELAAVVRAAVAELAERQRTAVELHQFEDCTYAEVAAEMDMTPKAAKSLLYRARNQLRDRLMAFVE